MMPTMYGEICDRRGRRSQIDVCAWAAESRAEYGDAAGQADPAGSPPAVRQGPASPSIPAATDGVADGVAGGIAGDGAGDGASAGAVLAELESVTARLAVLEVEQLADDEVDGVLDRLRRPLHQLEGVRARAAAVSQSRALARAGGAPSGAAVRDHQRRLAAEQQVTPAEVKAQIEAGRAVRDNAATARAVAAGEVGARHAMRIGQVLREVAVARREVVEGELLELAGRLDALAFGRAVRRILARERPEALAADERRQHLDRSVRATDTEDGGLAFSGLLYGTAAEQARVALNAFRRPDSPDEIRSPQQRGADAFEQLCAAALRSGAAPTDHGIRPQVMVVFTAEQYQALGRTPESTSGLLAASDTVVSGRELRTLVDDCELFRVVLDAKGAPMEVSTKVRTVPTGLWRALLTRDGGCVWQGCDAPASWCDVAHGDRAFATGGHLSIDNALLLCRSHHRRFDHGPYRAVIDGDEVTITRVQADQHPRQDDPPPPGASQGQAPATEAPVRAAPRPAPGAPSPPAAPQLPFSLPTADGPHPPARPP